MNLSKSILAREEGLPVTKSMSLAQEIEKYLEAQGEEPYSPPPTEVLSRWAKRAETLAAVRDELRQEVAELKERVKTLETLNGMLHANPPFSIMPTEYRGKLESVVEAAQKVMQSGCCLPCESIHALVSALDAMEEA